MVFICRLCGKCENESSGLAIFGEQGVKEALAYKIKLSLDISVSDIAVSEVNSKAYPLHAFEAFVGGEEV
jgi:hypothetical protein